MVGAYAGLRRRYCGLACGKHVRLQLPLFTAIVTTSAMYAGELWGVHPRSAAQRRMTAQKHSKFLRQLIRVSPSTETTILLAELGHLSLQQRWLHASIRFWNALVALPVDDLFRDALYDSLQDARSPGPRNAGCVKGVRDQCALLGFSLTADQPRLLPGCLETVMGSLGHNCSRRRSMWTSAHALVRRMEGAACCKYTRWFRRISLQCARPVHELPANPRKVLQLLRFRLGCHTLPSATGNAGTHACHAISASAPGVSTVWGMRGTWSLNARSCSTLEIGIYICSRDATRCSLL